MATLPLTLLNGIIADANEVMSLFYPIYGPPVGGTGIDQTNIDVANKLGTGRFLLETAAIPMTGLINNARLTLTAGRLKLVGDNGLDPSVTNPIVFRVPSTTGGAWETVTFISPTHCTIDDATTADSYFRGGAGTPWGTTSGVAWAGAFSEIPFMIYVCTDGITPVLFLARNPTYNNVPTSTQIGYKDTPPAAAGTGNIFGFTATNITVTHAGRPCWPIGSIRMTKATNDDWTIATLDNQDGLGNFHNFGARNFAMPISQNGATSGSYFSVSAGTAPVYDTINYYSYTVGLDGKIDINFNFVNSIGGTPGAGANNLVLCLPSTVLNSAVVNTGVARIFNSGFLDTQAIARASLFDNGIVFDYQNVIVTTMLSVTGGNQNQTSRTIWGQIRYGAYQSL